MSRSHTAIVETASLNDIREPATETILLSITYAAFPTSREI